MCRLRTFPEPIVYEQKDSQLSLCEFEATAGCKFISSLIYLLIITCSQSKLYTSGERCLDYSTTYIIIFPGNFPSFQVFIKTIKHAIVFLQQQNISTDIHTNWYLCRDQMPMDPKDKLWNLHLFSMKWCKRQLFPLPALPIIKNLKR